jgi:uncharacterized metal-binding protein YceD (DUF177 family)
MNALVAYSLPIMGLKGGINEFEFNLDPAFWSQFEGSPIEIGEVHFGLVLDKRADLLIFDFRMEGWVASICDRCTASIRLPLSGMWQLILKYGESEGMDDDEVVFIHRDTHTFNVAPYLYEFAVLALPITNLYPCEEDVNPPCNREVLDRIHQHSGEDKIPNAWDVLKDGQFDK